MASVQKKGTAYYCQFVYDGRRRTVTIGPVGRAAAAAFAERAEELLALLARGRLALPAGVPITDFILRDGKALDAESAPGPRPLPFEELRKAYLTAHQDGAMEANSLATVATHLTHVATTLGGRFDVGRLTLADVQRHVDRRRAQQVRGRRLSPVTLRKEVASFRAAWNWAVPRGLVTGSFPTKGLVYPKADEKPPFMTLREVERRIAAGGLTPVQTTELWESLYLRREEVDDLLAHVEAAAAHPWIYPLLCTAAHTGARRSELLRVEVTDVDLAGGVMLVREKKRSKRQRTTRHVSLTPRLKSVLQAWLASHPGGRFLFCQSGVVARSKKRSPSTGHRWGESRPTSLSERAAGVKERGPQSVGPLTKDEAHDHLKRTLAGSKWESVRGFHVLRHSFISCLAAAGVDQRIIDEFVGHQTDEQRKRYRHLIPDVKHKAIAGVFG